MQIKTYYQALYFVSKNIFVVLWHCLFHASPLHYSCMTPRNSSLIYKNTLLYRSYMLRRHLYLIHYTKIHNLIKYNRLQNYSYICPTRCNVTQFILSENCSTCFGWYHHPSSRVQTTVSTASGICHNTVTATCRYSGR
jgi:hypothetical protein